MPPGVLLYRACARGRAVERRPRGELADDLADERGPWFAQLGTDDLFEPGRCGHELASTTLRTFVPAQRDGNESGSTFGRRGSPAGGLRMRVPVKDPGRRLEVVANFVLVGGFEDTVRDRHSSLAGGAVDLAWLLKMYRADDSEPVIGPVRVTIEPASAEYDVRPHPHEDLGW
jgi:hypothetical protein